MSDTYEITAPFDDPFYEGTGPGEPDNWALPVSIDGRSFIVDLKPESGFSRRPIQLLNQQQQDTGGDQALVPPQVWRRSVESWHQGAGQSRYDREESLPSRFFDSRHIDVWDKWQMSLLPDTDLLLEIADLGRTWLTTVGPDLLAVVHETTVWWYTSLSVSSPDVTALPDVAVSVTTDGGSLYALLADGTVYRYADAADLGTLFATIPTFDPTKGLLAYVKGFLIAASGNRLYDVTTGTPALVYTHPLVNYRWVDACEGLNVAYVLGGIGDKWHVSRMGIKNDATTLDPPIVAAPLPEGEVGYALGSYLGYVVVGLSTGWRFGVPSADGALSFGRLVEVMAPVRCFEGQERFVWYGMSSTLDAVFGNSGLGRADLATFTEPATPAYATDLMGDTVDAVVWAVTTFGATTNRDGKRLFVVDGRGVFVQSEALCESGWLTQGSMTLGTNDPKMGAYVQVHNLPLDGSIAVDVSYDGSPFVEAGSNVGGGSVASGNIATVREFRTITLRWRLLAGADATLGPTVARTEFRALPVPGRNSEWRVPIVLADDINYDNAPASRDVAEDYDSLVNLAESRREFVYREGARSWNVYATDFLWQPRRLTRDGTTFQGLLTLVLREMK